jgi:Zn-dependent protease with chaperone function
LGHIAHWDFVVMTIAGSLPLILYILAEATWRGGREAERKLGGYLAIVGVTAYGAYFVSQYIVLLLSRVREYFADQFSASATGAPDQLASALVKIAYGLAPAPKDAKAKKDDRRIMGARPFGIFDPKMAQSLALVGASAGQVSLEGMTDAMKWDLWNPWSIWFEFTSSHPLPAKRIAALEKQTRALGRPSRYAFPKAQPEGYVDEFLFDLGVMLLPLIGVIVGLVVGMVAGVVVPCAGRRDGPSMLDEVLEITDRGIS